MDLIGRFPGETFHVGTREAEAKSTLAARDASLFLEDRNRRAALAV